MPLNTFRGWVEKIEDDGSLEVRGTHTNIGEEFTAWIEKDKIPAAEYAKVRVGSFWVWKVRTKRRSATTAGKQTFYVVEKYYTSGEQKKARKFARKLSSLFGDLDR